MCAEWKGTSFVGARASMWCHMHSLYQNGKQASRLLPHNSALHIPYTVRLRWVGHVASIEEMMDAYKIYSKPLNESDFFGYRPR